MPQPRTWREMRARTVAQLERQTGEGVDAWNARIAAQNPASDADLRNWLTAQGVVGYPRMFLIMERFGYPDYLQAEADELIDGQYADRPQLRPILEALLAAVSDIGEVDVQARKTYVTLLTPRRTFASIEPSTKSRVYLGLRMADQKAAGRLEAAKGMGQSVVTHRIGLASGDEVDDEVLDALRAAYAANV